MTANQEGPAARPHATTGPDSIELIARDAASYAEGAGEPEFSQFLQVEARLLALSRVLVAALEDARDVVRIAQVEGSDHGDRCRGLAQLTRDATRCMETIRTALRLAGKLP